MREKSGLHVALGIIGLAALMTYVLACWPSWSPDGSKILFPYYDPDAKEWGVALYNRTTGTVKSILLDKGKSDEDLPLVQWTRDGRRAIIAADWSHEKTMDILLVPIATPEPTRHLSVPFDLNDTFPQPFPEVAGNLYLGGKSLARVDLNTGEVEHLQLTKNEVALARWGESIVYLGAPTNEGNKVQFGELDPGSLELKPLFELAKSELEAHHVKDLSFLLTPEPQGSRFALLAEGEDKDVILVFNRAGLQKVLAPEISAEQFWLGGLQWASNGKTIYAAVLTPTTAKDIVQFSVGEIPLAAGPVRLTPIARIGGDPEERIFFQIALSPDGTTIAATTAHLKKVEAKDRALYLVNLRDPKRRVTKVPIPRPAKPAAAPKAQTKKEKVAP